MAFLQSESYKKGILLSVIFNGLAKAILFLLTIVIAGYFGNNIKTDIYFFIYSSMILFSGFINAVDTAVLIPRSMWLRENEGAAAAIAFLNFFLRIYVLTGAAFIAIMYCWGTSIFGLISKFSDADILLYKNYFLIGSSYFFFQIITTYFNNILTSLKFFTVPMIISGINSCIIIAGIILLHSNLDVLSVLISGVAAYTVNLVILLIVLKKAAHWNFASVSNKISKKVWDNVLFTELGQLVTVLGSYFPLYLLSGFGSGVISSMSYGKNIADIPNTLVTAQMANVSGIKLNEQFAVQNQQGMNDTFLRASKLLLLILIPLGGFMFVFAGEIVLLLYKRGNFTAGAVAETAKFLQLLSVTIFSIGINAMVSRIFIAAQAIRQAFYYQVAINSFLIVAIWLFTKWYGAYGYPYGVIVCNLLNFVLMYFICKKIFKQVQYGKLLQFSAIVFAVTLPVTIALFYVIPLSGIAAVYKLLGGMCIYLMVFIILSRITKVNLR